MTNQTQQNSKENAADPAIDPLLQAQVDRSSQEMGDESEAKPHVAPEVAAYQEQQAASDEGALSYNNEPVSDIDNLKAENATLKDQLLRTMADMENLKRRTEREKEDTAKYAVSNFAKNLLNVADNLRRAIESTPQESAENPVIKSILDGVSMTENELIAVLAKSGVERIHPKVGEDRYDYNLHQAMFEQPTEEHEPGVVTQVLQTGYQLYDRLLRPALVGVAKAAADVVKPNDTAA